MVGFSELGLPTDELEEHFQRVAARRKRVKNNVTKAQEHGWITKDKDAEEIASTLYSLIFGAAIQLLRNNSEENQQTQLAIIDQFIDSLVSKH